jgi:hypothetical protein
VAIAIKPTQAAPAAAAPVAAKPAAAAGKTVNTPAASRASVPKDTVTISTAAQTAAQEASETPAQTLKEATHGDPQATRLLAKEAAAKQS